MSQYNIAVVVGSLRRESYNRQLARAIEPMFPEGFSFHHLEIGDLPLYNQDDDNHPAPAVTRIKEQVGASDGVIFVTPEYNRAIPGVLKNAIDHASRPYGQSAWKDKPAGILGVSVGNTGTCMAQQHLRNVLAYLDMPTLGQPEIFLSVRDGMFTDDKNIAHTSTRELLQRWVDAYVGWIKRFASR